MNDLDTHEVIQPGEIEGLTAAEVATAIKRLKSGKAAGGDEIRPEMLKSIAKKGILWLTRVCQLAFKLGKTSKDWQTDVIILICKKGDHKQYTNCREISLLSLPGKCMKSALKEDANKQLNQLWKMVSVVFVQVAAPQLKSSL